MIIITAGHSGPSTGAQGVEIAPKCRFDEGSQTIWLRNRIAEILTLRYCETVLIDNDRASLSVVRRSINLKASPKDFLIDIHFNAHSDPNARGCESIVADDATDGELMVASRLAHAVARVLDIPLRGIKSESQTPRGRLAMLHLRTRSVILEVCFATNIYDVRAYLDFRENLAQELAFQIHSLRYGSTIDVSDSI